MTDKKLQVIKEFPGKACFVHYFVYSCAGLNGIVKGPEPRVAQYLRETFHKEYGPAIVMQSHLAKREITPKNRLNTFNAIPLENTDDRIREIMRLRSYNFPTITGIYVLGMTDETRNNVFQVSINKVRIRKGIFRWDIVVKDIRIDAGREIRAQEVYRKQVRNIPQKWFEDLTQFVEGKNLQYLQHGREKIFKQMEKELKELRNKVNIKNTGIPAVKLVVFPDILNSKVDNSEGIEF